MRERLIYRDASYLITKVNEELNREKINITFFSLIVIDTKMFFFNELFRNANIYYPFIFP